jgi:hypothetical protein
MYYITNLKQFNKLSKDQSHKLTIKSLKKLTTALKLLIFLIILNGLFLFQKN